MTNLIDRRIVDDLIGNPNPLIRKLLSGLVSNLHGALNAPTEPVGLGELHGHGSPGVLESVLLQLLNDITFKISKFK